MSLDIQTLERTALCVAACDGIDTADLKAGSVSIIQKLHDEAAQRVLAQRDELLAALKECAQGLAWLHHGECRGYSDNLVPGNKALEMARRAIAKVEGGA
jgi:hypothetical protein